MRFFLIFIISCLITPLSFPQNQRFLTALYSNYLKGLLCLDKGEYLKGLKEFERAKARDPKSIHIRLKIATVLIRLDKIEAAEKVLKEAKKMDPDNLDISLILILVYSHAKKNEELEKEYEGFLRKAHEIQPKDVGISEYLGQFYFHKKKPQEAIKIYEKILENNPDYIEALFWLGYLYERVGRYEDTISTWKKGLDVDPSYAPILNSLGYIYAEKGIKLDEAEGMIRKALEKEPENGAYLDSLGWVCFKKGDYKEAEKYLSKAVSYIRDPEIYMHLGDLYIKLDDMDKGLKCYREGVLHFPDHSVLKSKIEEYERKSKVLKE